MNNKKYKLSIIIPCRNEEKYIKNCVNSLINQKEIDFDYEIILVDGMSEDKTQQIIKEMMREHDFISLIINEKGIVPPGMNLGIKAAKGEIVARCDAHSIYDEYYIKNGMDLLDEHPEADCVGGPVISIGDTLFGKATAVAMSRKIGVGNANHRFPKFEGYAETTLFPFFRRKVFEYAGYFDERFVRNQDDEFTFRIRLNGGKVYISPRVKSEYFVRSSPKKLFSQYFQYGYWRYFVLKKHKKQISFRQLIPSLFLLSILFFLMLGIFLNSIVLAVAIPIVYLLVLILYSISVMIQHGMLIGLNFVIAIITMHISYGIGLIWAVVKNIFSKEDFK